jgi:hypothetical protein
MAIEISFATQIVHVHAFFISRSIVIGKALDENRTI